jgi:hypothetical protein
VSAPSPAEFMAQKGAPAPPNGSSPWAARYGGQLRQVLTEHAARAPRTLQQHLGPSELGVECDRQVAGKFAALPSTNNIVDPWPSIRGTALHAYAAEAFTEDNIRRSQLRWIAEQRVVPHPDHAGTADLYDAWERAVVDHKFLGESSMAKVRKAPPRKYEVQLFIYGRGYHNLGLPVNRVVLAAYPATAGSLNGLYVWEREVSAESDALVDHVLFTETPRRKAFAARILAGEMGLMDVPGTTDDDECYFCPFYRTQSATDGGYGCPGAKAVVASG